MKLPQRTSVFILAGLVLLVSGAALALTVSYGPWGQAATSEQEVRPAVTGSSASGTTQSPSTAPLLAVTLGPDGTPQPFWRVKQQEAREHMAVEATSTLTTPETVTPLPGSHGAPTALPLLPHDSAEPRTREIRGGGQTSLQGVWAGQPDELARYLLNANSRPRFTVSTSALAQYYVRYAAEARLRADVLWAQMIHETGYGRYDGGVRAEQNNFAGIGATGGGNPGLSFLTAEDGVKAHIAHMVAYVYVDDKTSWSNSLTDPRYGMVNPRGMAQVLSDLDGRWAVPGIGYGAAIDRHVEAINR